ncbi:hypothetical protein CDAR_597651 [Caerostris darwini]|uniref:Uncharacterized protein n=1 Tax=Caerostris darwini TaxID=1538125 RepID=A0AAV4X2X8_9ARAC|nr:hypothetical protein CDAR_597651 [Caerostris darwini]
MDRQSSLSLKFMHQIEVCQRGRCCIEQATSRTAPNTRLHWSSIFGQMGNLVPNPCGIATIDSDSPLLRQTQPPTPLFAVPLPPFLDSFNLPVPPVFPPYWSHTADSSARIIHRACAVASYRSIVVQVQGSLSS